MDIKFGGSSEFETEPSQDNEPDEGLDLPPEYCHYRDEGCELTDSCLNCPFPQCVHDEPGGTQRWRKRTRDKEIIRMFSSEGKEVKELAVIFGISQRTIQRALKNSLEKAENSAQTKTE